MHVFLIRSSFLMDDFSRQSALQQGPWSNGIIKNFSIY